MRISCAISPDADDLFMFRGITQKLIDTEGIEFAVQTADTDALNRLAIGEGADINAISIAWYPKVAQHFQLFNHGGSVGRGYGPVLVAKEATRLEALAGKKIGVPGLSTTAYLVLKQVLDFEPVVLPIQPYQRVFTALSVHEVEAAVLIHEGRLTWESLGLKLVADLGVWWQDRYGLPLPLGGNVVRRSLGKEVIATLNRVVKRSIQHGLDHRKEAIDWLLGFGGALKSAEQVDRYLGMYANQDTLDYGEDGRNAIRLLAGFSGWQDPIDFVGVSG
jgi:1,4-dihydroxy-6-naphthoate synthase